MSAKEEVIKINEELPNNVTLEDIINEISVKSRIQKGLDQLTNGEFYSHEEVKKSLLNG